MVYGGWNGQKIEQGFIFNVIILAQYTFLVKIKDVKVKNLHTSTHLNLNYGTTEQKPKMLWLLMVEFIKTCDQYPCKFNFGHFFSSLILLPFCWEKIQKMLCGGNGKFPPAWSVNDKNLGEIFALGHSKNEQIHFFDSQMHFLVILTPWIWNLSATMVHYTGFRNMRGCILEVNSEGLGW